MTLEPLQGQMLPIHNSHIRLFQQHLKIFKQLRQLPILLTLEVRMHRHTIFHLQQKAEDTVIGNYQAIQTSVYSSQVFQVDAVGEGTVISVHPMTDVEVLWIEIVQHGIGIVLLACSPYPNLGNLTQLLQKPPTLRPHIDPRRYTLPIHHYCKFNFSLWCPKHTMHQCLIQIQNDHLIKLHFLLQIDRLHNIYLDVFSHKVRLLHIVVVVTVEVEEPVASGGTVPQTLAGFEVGDVRLDEIGAVCTQGAIEDGGFGVLTVINPPEPRADSNFVAGLIQGLLILRWGGLGEGDGRTGD